MPGWSPLRFEPLGYDGPLGALAKIRRDFTYAASYLDDTAAYLCDILGLSRGILYGCVPTVHGNRVTVSAGMIVCGGRYMVEEITIGLRPHTSGYVVVGTDLLPRVVDTLPAEPHVCLFAFSADDDGATIDDSVADRALQLHLTAVSTTIPDISLPPGVTRRYTLTHDVAFAIPGYCSVEATGNLVAFFVKETETPTSFDIDVTQLGSEGGTVTAVRTGLAPCTSWY